VTPCDYSAIVTRRSDDDDDFESCESGRPLTRAFVEQNVCRDTDTTLIVAATAVSDGSTDTTGVFDRPAPPACRPSLITSETAHRAV